MVTLQYTVSPLESCKMRSTYLASPLNPSKRSVGEKFFSFSISLSTDVFFNVMLLCQLCYYHLLRRCILGVRILRRRTCKIQYGF